MSQSGEKTNYKPGSICNGLKQNILFAWALDAQNLVLPKDVAFKTGAQTFIKYLVIQIHFSSHVVGSSTNSLNSQVGITVKGQYEP